MDLDDVVPEADHATRQSRVIDAPASVVWEELHRLQVTSLPVTLLLNLVEMVIILAMAIPIGVLSATRHGRTSVEEIQREHVSQTTRLLASRSALIHDHVTTGRLAIVGAEYALADGRVRLIDAVGEVETGG